MHTVSRAQKIGLCERAYPITEAARSLVTEARENVRNLVAPSGIVDVELLNQSQRMVHGLAWFESIVAALEAVAAWARSLDQRGCLTSVEEDLIVVLFGEYCAQLAGGVPISANEIVRPAQLGVSGRVFEDAVGDIIAEETMIAARGRLTAFIRDGGQVAEDFGDEIQDAIRDQFRRFTAAKITPFAHQWHLQDALIPDALIAELAELGTFGICIGEHYGGLGLGKLEMCIVSEELSRGWIAAGSLGTRSEIAGELISAGGLEEQKAAWLPKIANGDVLPAAVFTEPGAGSDLAALKTRAERQDDGSWRIFGAKTWITHGSRSDLMTLLARTGGPGSAGLSMFLVPKERGTEQDPFPAEGISGNDIEVLGYRGMREYEVAFDGFVSPADSLLGGEEGQGFRQLMRTFEGARIQTAARAVGVAWRAYELGLSYALERKQFGRLLFDFPRVADKLVMMLAETVAVRELTYFAAREKDSGKRCDIEAGMAKLLAARVAWANADSAVQIHGGNGYALEFEVSRILCDARILSIFEGAAEVQAQIIARGLLASE